MAMGLSESGIFTSAKILKSTKGVENHYFNNVKMLNRYLETNIPAIISFLDKKENLSFQEINLQDFLNDFKVKVMT